MSAFTGCQSLNGFSGTYGGIVDGVMLVSGTILVSCAAGPEVTAVTIPDSVTGIGHYVFIGCTSLASVVMPDSVTAIGYSAFSGCVALSSINISSAIDYIAVDAFSGLAFLGPDGEALRITPGDLAGRYFEGSGDGILKTAVPRALDVGERFASGGLVYEVTSQNPASVSLVGYEGSPSSVAVPASVSYLGFGYVVVSVGPKAFYECAGLRSVSLPDTVKTVGNYAFFRCTSLESVGLGSVESVGLKSFSYCGSLTEISIPATLTKIGGYAFFSCGLTSVEIPGDGVVLEPSAFSACKSMSDIRFTGSGAVIGRNAFYNNNGVSSVDLSTVASVGFKAFPYCNGLKSVTIPGHISVVGEYAFFNCANLKEITVEDGVRKIGKSAFSGCKAMEMVDLPETLVYIGPNAFHGVKFLDLDGKAMDPTLKLRGHTYFGSGKVLRMAGDIEDGERFSAGGIEYSVSSAGSRGAAAVGFSGAAESVPAEVSYKGWILKVATVADKAFYGCSTLKSADLTNVRSIGMKAFANCASLEEVSFGESLESVRAYAFYGLALYDGKARIQPATEALAGHSFSGSGAKLYLVS
jgi:hypothetical protein